MYAHSAFKEKARESRTFVFLDLDRTLAWPDPSPTEFVVRDAVRKLLEDMGAVVIFTTARAPEMLMDSTRLTRSLELGFPRMPPLQGTHADGTRYFKPLELLPEFSGVLNPDIIHSCGGGIYGSYGSDAYLPDSLFNDFPGMSWRSPRLAIIHDLDGGTGSIVRHMPLIENLNNYFQAKADVMPLPYRIQFDFKGEDAFERMMEVRRLLKDALRFYPKIARRTKFVDESRPADKKFCFYWLARKKTKEAALAHIVRNIMRVTGLKSSDLNIFVGGDALTDLPSIFAIPGDSNGMYGLPSQAPVTSSLFGDAGALFAGESLRRFTRRLTAIEEAPGHFWLKPPMREPLRLMAGDLATPGTTSAESVLAQLLFFRDNLRK